MSQVEARLEVALGLKAYPFRGTYSTGNDPLINFYIPALERACSYDRAAGYFSARVLKAAARGLVPFLNSARETGGKMRLIVGAQLEPEDVVAIRTGTRDRGEMVRAAVDREDLAFDGDPIGDEYLKMLGWMVREGLLEVKVGIPVDDEGLPLEPDEAHGYFHSKYGVLTDASGDRIAFTGSDNETASGWIYNHETFVVAKSWLDEVWTEQGKDLVTRFDAHWRGRPDEGWVVVDMAGVEDRLLSLVPHDYAPPETDPIWKVLTPGQVVSPAEPDTPVDEALKELAWLAAAPARSRWTAVGTAPVDPLPHQARLIHRVVETYPRGYLFADEVGLGKTIETGLSLRELLLSETAQSALLLVPASVMKQWQEELHEKVGLDVPRYVGSAGGTHLFRDRNDHDIDIAAGNPWSAFPVVLGSSHLARRKDRRREIIEAGPWDVVLVDEAHHARRRGSKPTDTPNSLLSLLMDMRAADSWNALYLASATPMQMNAHEAWDLIELLGLPGRWGQSAKDFISYYEKLRTEPGERDWKTLSAMLADYFSQSEAGKDSRLEDYIQGQLGMVKSQKIIGLAGNPLASETAKALTAEEVDMADEWLRRHTPMRDRVFRNTRDTMRAYQAAGIIPEEVNIPHRHVTDEFIELTSEERLLYDRIEDYIRRHYNSYKTKQTQQALGFIMTVYRRRLTSSFEAIRCSLRRRLNALENGLALGELLSDDDQYDVEGSLFEIEEFDASATLLVDEIQELKSFLASLDSITGEDSKASQLTADLNAAFLTYDSAVVFTQYTDTMEYVRERVIVAGLTSVGCYSGRGGEVYEPATRAWVAVTKSEIKDLFRTGQVRILIGTDSMSEGLNLQTCGRLINYDMPWNLMRVEQRIGRIDRIGSSHKDIQISNYFYADTVEQRVYEGILEDYGDFTEIVGSAQPVLASVEEIIKQIALTETSARDDAIETAVAEVRQDIQTLNQRTVQAADMGSTEIQPPPILIGEITLEVLEERLTTNPLTRPRLHPDPKMLGIYLMDGSLKTTFQREMLNAIPDDVLLLTYGQPILHALLGTRVAATGV
ncbi:MAG: DEAD/DEAH box helicase family protein [Acidobacteria bacterium]|nr:DEAD/DEAH box helicase family protein [Acidobacteriota bacterium]